MLQPSSLRELRVRFQGSILGFEKLDEFMISVLEEDSPFAHLQSLQDHNIGFLVANPFVFYPDYTFEIEEKDQTSLKLQSLEDVVVYNTVTVREPFTKSTINLLAPLVVNIHKGEARQIVLPPKSSYGTAEPLFQVGF